MRRIVSFVASIVALTLLAACPQSRRVEIPGDASIVDGAARDAAVRDAASGDAAARDAAIDPALVGIVPSSCGQPDQGLVPVDCTARGDTGSQCVFGNHCFCSEGFRCEIRGDFEPECDPGVICVPR